jgi:hypothetical protein
MKQDKGGSCGVKLVSEEIDREQRVLSVRLEGELYHQCR